MYALSLTDGTTTATFTTAPDVVLDYVPTPCTPAPHLSRSRRPGRDPGRGVAGAGEPGSDGVSEKIKLAWTGDTLALALADRDVVDRLLRQAARVEAGSGEARVYLQAQRASDLPLYRSEVLDGAVEEVDIDGYWPGRGVVRAVIGIVRRAYWEGAEAEIGLLNADAQYVTGGLQVRPAWGAAHVDLGAIAGELAAPLRMAFYYGAAGGAAVGRVYAGLMARGSVSGFTWMLEAEDSLIGILYESGNASGGSYRSVEWTSALEYKVASWTVNSAWLQKAGGRWYRAVARIYGNVTGSGLVLQLRVYVGTALLWAGPWVSQDGLHQVLELANVLLPPGDAPLAANKALKVELYGLCTEAAVVPLDYIAFFGLDAYRRYDDLGGGLAAADDYLMDDGPAGQVYAAVDGGLGVVGSWVASGDVLEVRPGYQHRLGLLWEAGGSACDAGMTATVRLWYRPRVVIP